MKWLDGRESLKFWRSQLNRRYIVTAVLVALAYIVTAKLGLSLAFSTRQVTTVWPPTGIALVVIMIWGYRYWPAILVGAYLANIFTSEPWLVAVGIAIGNTLEAVVGAVLIQRLAHIQPRQLLDNIRNILLFVVLAAFVSTTVSATIGTTSLALGGVIHWNHFGRVWPVWWVGDLMGDLIFVPVLLCVTNLSYLAQLWARRIEAGLMLALSLAAGVVIFSYNPQGHQLILPFAYMVFPFLIWAAFRFTQIGVATALFVVSMSAIWGTVTGLGPFTVSGSVEQNLIFLQIFLLTVGITALLVAAVVAERARAIDGLKQAQGKVLEELEKQKKLEEQLQEANRRITNILAGVLDESSSRRSL